MRSGRVRREALLGLAFVVPALVVFGVFVFYPFARNFWLGFHTSNPFTGASRWVGWKQWQDRLQLGEIPYALVVALPWAIGGTAVFGGLRRWRTGRVDVRNTITAFVVLWVLLTIWVYSNQWVTPQDFTHALHVTLVLTVYTVPVAIAVGLGLAVLLHKRLRGVPIFRLAYAIPIVAGPGVAGVLFLKLFNPQIGFIPWLLDKHDGVVHLVDLSQSPLQNPKWALLAVAAVLVWMNLGLAFILMSAGLQGVPEDLYEAAEVDGASAWSQFWRVTIPMMSPTLFFAFVLGTILAMVQSFGVIQVMTGGGPHPEETTTTLPVLIVHLVTSTNPNLNLAGIYSVGLFVITLTITIFQLRIVERWVTYER